MDEASSEPKANAFFPTGVSDPDGLVELGADAWPLVRLAATGGCGLGNMRLVRWRELRAFLGKRWAETGPDVARTLRREIDGRLRPDGVCLRYDDFSYLVACSDPADPFLHALDDDFAAEAAGNLAGIPGTTDMIEVWKPVSIEDGGFRFERIHPSATRDVAAETGPAPASDPLADPPVDEGKLPRTVILGDAVFRRFPLWDVRGNEVFCHLFEAFWDQGDGEPMPEEAFADQFGDPKRALALDLETLAKATDELDRGLDRYQLMTFLIPVHYDTLADPARSDTYLRFCNRKIWSVREFAYFEIVKPPPALSAEGLAQAAQGIAPFGAGVMLRVGQGFDAFDRVPADDVFSVGMDLRLDGRPEGDTIAELEALAAGAGARGLHSHVHGLKAMTLSVAAACAGIDFIGSDALAPGLDEAEPDEPMPKPIDLFKSLLAASRAGKGGADL